MLPVGGVRQKVLAAHRAGLTRVLLPAANEKDLHDVSPKIRAELDLVFVRTMEEAVKLALLPARPAEATQEDAGCDGLEGGRARPEPQPGVLARPSSRL